MHHSSRTVAFVFATGIAVSLAFILAYFGRRELVPAIPAAPVLALLLLGARPLLLDRMARPIAGARAPIVTALAVAAMAPLVVAGALSALAEPLLYSGFFRCGTPRASLEVEVPMLLLPVGAVSAIVSLLVARRPRRLVDGGVRWLGLGLAAVTAVLLLAALVRAARLPDGEGYARALPVVARVQVISGAPTRVMLPDDGSTAAHGLADVYDDEVEGVILRRVCAEHRCGATLVPRGTPVTKIALDHWDVDEDGTVLVRRDAARALWVVEGRGAHPFLGEDLHRDDVRVSDVAGAVSPPRGWMLGAALGLAIAGMVLARRRRVAGLLPLIEGGREGALEPSGLVTLVDGDHPLRVASGQALQVGPVIVLPGAVAPGGVYRGDGPLVGARVLCGRRDELLADTWDRVAALDALVVAALALLGAPLAASALVGIVL
jgi:hypothetical protein